MTQPRPYPKSRRDETIETVHHGVRVSDPYRWLEDAESEETKRWIEAQNTLTEAHLRTISPRGSIRKHLAGIWNEPHVGVPWRRGRWWFEMRHDGVQDQEVLFVGAGVAPPTASEFRPLLDVNRLSPDGTVSLTRLAVTSGGERLAYGLSAAGSDWMTWRVRDVATGEDLDDVVRWSKFGSAAWLPDGKGLIYSWYAAPEPGTEFAATSLDQKLRLHVLGTPQDLDPIVHEEPAHPNWTFDPITTHDGRWLIVSIWEGGLDSNRIFVAPIEGNAVGRLRPLIADTGARFEFVGVAGRSFVFLTNHDAPRGRVVAVDPACADSCAWETLVPESEERIDAVRFLGGTSPGDDAWLLLHRWRDATSRLSLIPLAWSSEDSREGNLTSDQAALAATPDSQNFAVVAEGPDVELSLPPSLGSILALTGDRQDGRFHVQYETFLAPAQVFSGNLSKDAKGEVVGGPDMLRLRPDGDARISRSGELPASISDGTNASDGSNASCIPDAANAPALVRGGRAAVTDHDESRLLTEQVFVEHDGVRIPVFLLRRADIQPTGDVPTLLYGYGGFDVAITASYSVPWRVWVERGGLVAVACLRGGGEYGKAWHDAGKTPYKQNVFDDAIAVATWLTGEWTSPPHLGILGRSNGGLLVGACMTQRPDLFGACVPEVGVMDMLRFHLFTIGWAWVSDYGSAENEEQFRELYAYSPLHHLREGACYPPTLITTGDHDDRVVPGHSFKFAAALQHAQGCEHPALIRVDVAAGHGAGKPLSKRIDERADVLAFFAHHLGLE